MKKYIIILFALLIYGNVHTQTAAGDKKFKEGEYTQALYWYEKGIDSNPMADSNYYGATKVFFLSTETVWGVMYGEIFMLVSQNDSLRMEISKELFDAYFSSLSLNKGRTVAHFCSDIIVYSDSFERRNLFPVVFDNLMSEAAHNIRYIDIEKLYTLRKSFLTLLKQRNGDFMNPLFAYWDEIIKNNHWEAYNYWLFAYGNNNESAQWIGKHKDKWSAFLSWLDKNPLTLDENNYFSRYLME